MWGTVFADRVVKPKKEDWSALFSRMDEASQHALFEQLQKIDTKTSSSSSSVGPILRTVGFAKAVDPTVSPVLETVGFAEAVDSTVPRFDTNSADADNFIPNKQRHLTLETQA